LIQLFEADGGEDSGFMRERDGKTVSVTDYGFKKRRDFNLEDGDPALLSDINDIVLNRIKPEIEKAFQFSITRFERHVVACYDGKDRGFFNRHRDNTTKGTAHRRFAMTVNLNTGEYEGGCLWFPEYGTQLYRPEIGEAVIFSCSLLHEATPVTSGRRFALLSFFYNDEDAKLREQNRQYLEIEKRSQYISENISENPNSNTSKQDSSEEPVEALSEVQALFPLTTPSPQLPDRAADPVQSSLPRIANIESTPKTTSVKAKGFQTKRKKAENPSTLQKTQRILLLHANFPAQFRHLAAALAKRSHYQVVFGTTCQDRKISGVRKVIYTPTPRDKTIGYSPIQPMEEAVLHGRAAALMAEKLKEEGFTPDVIYGHSGWGSAMFMKDVFPEAKVLGYFEWFHRAHGSDCDFDPDDPLTMEEKAIIRIKNAPILLDLYACDQGLTPTHWQQQQFPSEFHPKLKVLHDGIDTEFFQPNPGAKLVLPQINLYLNQVEELVTYVARGMEPYRGFPQFIEAMAIVQRQRPHCHAVVVGQDRVAYGASRPDGKTYKQFMLETVPLDCDRIHFTGLLSYPDYLRVLQASSVHVYLTYPFVLSWSMLEALSTGCLVVASHTPPVQEVIEDEVNGLLVDFFSPQKIADRILEALDDPGRMTPLRTQARQTIVERYNLDELLPQHIDWLHSTLSKS
jgi:glycosyltransferase involved in cell wall biosynthesis/predicted 2-oxoglutarate/Fe(II)-dependent dioxygenase YbiX